MGPLISRSIPLLLMGVFALTTTRPLPLAAQSRLDKLQESIGLSEKSRAPPQATLVDGLKEALRVSTKRVVAQLGREGGFNTDSAVHIPLPEKLQQAQSLLAKAGLSSYGEALELRLNRAAETAVPEGKAAFMEAIRQMTVADAKAIVTGPEDAATQYFRETMTPELRKRMRPVIDNALGQVGAIKRYDRFMSRYQSLPLAPDIKANLTSYTLSRALDGVFHYMATEEAAIRNNPAKRTTELLKKVFEGR